ncbi:Fc.00g058810.m01.CDS01 [Cosmosporella sp. VM-42]
MKISSLLALSLTGLANATPSYETQEYEYVVVGSGPGGGPLAANLARAGHTVLLIEAGQDRGDSLLQRIPAWADQASEAPDMSWHFFVNHFRNETQARRDNKYTYRLNNGSYYVGLDPPNDAEPLGIYYPRGATVGGSAQVNAMNLALPPDEEWRRIAESTGDNSWQPEQMRRYFIELERNQYLPDGEPGHGYDGYISSERNNVSFITTRAGVARLLQEAFHELEGIDVEDEGQMVELLERDMNRLDTNRYEEQGIYQMPLHINSLKERSGSRNYVIETLEARNEDGSPKYPLTLSTGSLATRVLFTKATSRKSKPRACGVEYLVGDGLYAADDRYNATQKGEIRRAKATREVILAAGAFNTPQLLKLSGIGPRRELEDLDIPVVADIPAVGHYMTDNYEGGVTVRANLSWENNPYAGCRFDPTLPASEDPCLQQWENDHVGPYGEGGAPIAMWFRSSVSDNNDSDVFFFGAASVEFRGYFPGYSREVVPASTFFWSMVKMQVGNHAGTITLRSKNPRDTPLINFNWFEQNREQDLQALAEGAEFAIRMFNATGDPYTPFEVIEPTPGIDTKQAIMDNTFSHHVTSTCRMGPKDNKDYCVDSKFRVNGVKGLRVVDASVFPRTPGAFPVGPTFMISQKATGDILADLKKRG